MMLDRRRFLKVTLGSGVTLAASGRIPTSAAASVPNKSARAVIWLWMGGGLSQLDTWDPKPGSRNQGPFKAINTAVPGIQVTELLPTCASQMKHLAIIRSMKTGVGDRKEATYLMHTGWRPTPGDIHPVAGTVISYLRGRKEAAFPKFVAMSPPRLPLAPHFPDEDQPYYLRNSDDPIPNLLSPVGAEQEGARRALLREQNGRWEATRRQEPIQQLRAASAKAERMMDAPLLRAFDWKSEPEELRRKYGGRFGTNCLLARRLVEAGSTFVEIGLGGWGTHDNNFQRLRLLVPQLDQGMGTLIRDLADRDLLKETLVVCCTEYGKTPSINGNRGRDYWSRGFSVVLAGGPIRGGQVYGDTGPDGMGCEKPVSAPDFLATIYKACGIDHTQARPDGVHPGPFLRNARAIDDLF